MINADNKILAMFNKPVRDVVGSVEHTKEGITKYYKHTDNLKEFTVDRTGEEGKFFGFGVCHKANIKFVDINRAIEVTTADEFKVYLGCSASSARFFPSLYPTETHRDENTNELSITCYDALYKAAELTVAQLSLEDTYTIKDFINACCAILGLNNVVLINVPEEAFSLSYEGGANFDGAESIREALTMAAEVTQTIYYIDANNNLVFKRLDMNGEAALEIAKKDYFTLTSKDNKRLSTLVSATELGDNLIVSTAAAGSTQYIRNNAFWDLREDREILLEEALVIVAGFTINQFEIQWRGNFLLEAGDKIDIVTKDNNKVTSYLLNDSIYYNGALNEYTQWNYTEGAEESANPTNIGDALKQTYAKVDKVNKQVEIVVTDIEGTKEEVSRIASNAEEITASIQSVEKITNSAINSINDEIASLTSKVEATLTDEDVQLKIETELSNGVDKVITSTGYKFNDEGLTVSKENSEMTTTITENGMKVYRDKDEVLTADNTGVYAENLHATTYLIIGTTSRLEEYGGRTGCFWIG